MTEAGKTMLTQSLINDISHQTVYYRATILGMAMLGFQRDFRGHTIQHEKHVQFREGKIYETTTYE